MAGKAHLDIKLENILITDDGVIKLCDLSFMEDVDEPQVIESGTTYFQSPQMISMTECSPRSADIFALGVLLFYMLCQDYPF